MYAVLNKRWHHPPRLGFTGCLVEENLIAECGRTIVSNIGGTQVKHITPDTGPKEGCSRGGEP